MLINGDLDFYRLKKIETFEFNTHYSSLYRNINSQDVHFYYHTNSMELFSLSNSNLLHNEENSRLVPDQYVEMINSRDISIVEFPKLKILIYIC